ncbi:hypothetical protein [Actinocorallia herbida]|uniref:hypothetical protein n=1 Tax=Actinocorallia herbida TaxID=58109 RepID=UPI000F4D17B3|nr:hypothetical protein [Actinocorallia herbida]
MPEGRVRPFLLERLRDSREHRQEVELARAWGVPRSRWLGREPRTVTTYEYDDGGRLLRSVTETEPLWTDEDRGWAEALAHFEADECKGCGQPLSESTEASAEGAYDAPLPLRCHACTAVSIQQDAASKNAHPTALLYEVHRK